VYFGEYERAVDYKGRLSIPPHLMESSEDPDWSRVMVLKAAPPCLYLYDLQTWRAILDEAYRTMDDDEGRLFMHRALSDAQVVDLDNMKRITLPGPLLAHAAIEKKTTIVGMFNRLELWSPAVWSGYLESLEDVPVPDIADLSRLRIRQVS